VLVEPPIGASWAPCGWPVERKEGEAMKKLPAKRNPMAREIAKAQYRRRIKPDKRRAIEAKRMKRQLLTGAGVFCFGAAGRKP